MAHFADAHVAFFYGTLMSPEVLYRVIYGTASPDPWQKDKLNIRPALLYGYQRHRVKDADYPAIYPIDQFPQDNSTKSNRVLGTVVQGLSEGDIMRLDIFEGEEYWKTIAQVHPLSDIAEASEHEEASSKITIFAETYVYRTEFLERLEPGEWDIEEFRREKLRYWAGPEVTREDYEAVDTAVANGTIPGDGTGGRGANGNITKQLAHLDKNKTAETV